MVASTVVKKVDWMVGCSVALSDQNLAVKWVELRAEQLVAQTVVMMAVQLVVLSVGSKVARTVAQ